MPFLKQKVNHTNKLLTCNSRLSFTKRASHRRLFMGMPHYLPCVTDGHNLLAKMLGLKLTVSQIIKEQQRTFRTSGAITLCKRANSTIPNQDTIIAVLLTDWLSSFWGSRSWALEGSRACFYNQLLTLQYLISRKVQPLFSVNNNHKARPSLGL